METTKKKETCALVVIYNQNFEKNIQKIRDIYSSRFSKIVQIMPFYYGCDPDVIPVYGTCYQFQAYYVQARRQLLEVDCDRFLFIADDLLLNPKINERNVAEQLKLAPGDFYIDCFADVASGEFTRAVTEAHRIQTKQRDLDASASRILPSYEEAFKILKDRGLATTTRLRKYVPLLRPLKRPLVRKAKKNAFNMLRNGYHILKRLSYLVFPRRMKYPCVYGYSDIVSIPKSRYEDWVRYVEVFTVWRMFVELSIPTAMALLKDVKIVTNEHLELKSGNVWYPQDQHHHLTMERVIENLVEETGGTVRLLAEKFPPQYLYLHPVKLSVFK